MSLLLGPPSTVIANNYVQGGAGAKTSNPAKTRQLSLVETNIRKAQNGGIPQF